MDQEILTTLQEIRGLLFILTTAICIVVVILFMRNIGRAFIYLKSSKEDDFINEANEFFESENYNKLVEVCENKLKKLPNHSSAIWWLARAKLKTGEELEAKKLFERLLELEPSWEETYIEPYLEKISF